MWLKIQRLSLNDFHASANILTKLLQETGELWTTNKKVIARILTYLTCSYTVRWRKFIRHVVLVEIPLAAIVQRGGDWRWLAGAATNEANHRRAVL